MRNKFIYIYVSLVLLVSVITVSSNEVAFVSVPHFRLPYLKPIMIYGLILLFFFLITLTARKIKLDVVVILLYMKLIIVLIPLIGADPSDYLGSYALVIVDLLIYTIAIQFSEINHERIINVINFFALVVVIHVFLTFIDIRESYNYLYYKNLMVIPYGASNYISSFLIPIVIALSARKSTLKTKLIIIILIVGVVMTKSRGAILLIALYYGAVFIKKMVCALRRRNALYSVRVAVYFFLVVCIVNVVLRKGVDSFFGLLKGYSSLVTDGGILNKLSSGRITIYFDRITEAFKRPILGYGPIYQDEMIRAHNFLIDSFYESGLIGLAVNLMILILIFIRIREFSSDRFIKYAYWFGIITIINSLYEISLFSTVYSDFLFFTIMGLAVSRHKKLSKIEMKKRCEGL